MMREGTDDPELSPAVFSRLVSTLAGWNLIGEESDPGNDREKLYCLTPDGELAIYVYLARLKKRGSRECTGSHVTRSCDKKRILTLSFNVRSSSSIHFSKFCIPALISFIRRSTSASGRLPVHASPDHRSWQETCGYALQ